MAVANEIAPEHLELCCEDPQSLVPLVRNAGAVFLGPYAPASPRRLHRRPEPHPADVRIRPLLERARRGGLPPQGARHLRRPGSPGPGRSHIAAIAKAEGLAAHARSALLRSATASVGTTA